MQWSLLVCLVFVGAACGRLRIDEPGSSQPLEESFENPKEDLTTGELPTTDEPEPEPAPEPEPEPEPELTAFELHLDPPSLIFPEQWLGYSSSEQEIVVSNIGDTVASGLVATLGGEHPDDFLIDSSACGALAPTESCTVFVRFTPTASARRTASVEMGNGAHRISATLMGLGIYPSDYNRVFVSSETILPTLGSTEPYDAMCNKLASSAGINDPTGSAYIAWVSSVSSPARERLGDARGFVRMDGRAFADDLLAGGIFRSVEFDEYGSMVPLNTSVVTGTRFDGTASENDCRGLAATNTSISAGRAHGGPRDWTSRSSASCFMPWRVYCVETTKSKELVPPRSDGRLIFLANEDIETGSFESFVERCSADKPPGAGPVVPLIATDTIRAMDVLDDNAVYVRPDGILVGTGAELRIGTWQSGAWQQGNGAYPDSARRVWTGSQTLDAVGTVTCSNWTERDREVRGFFTNPLAPSNDGSFWGPLFERRCSSTNVRIYCVETGAP